MVNNLINDKSEQASLDLHNYMTAKMKEVSGISAAVPETTDTEIDTDMEVVDDMETEVG